jgi:hypothetical protein
MNFQPTKIILNSLIETLKLFTPQEFTLPISPLSNATIGEHTRHIIELYQCLLMSYANGNLNYDNRERNKVIENNIDIAIEHLTKLCDTIEKDNKKLELTDNNPEFSESIETNYFREVVYNFEHCIHHQALIKVGLLALNKMPNSTDFGVAPSTLAYKKACVQ